MGLRPCRIAHFAPLCCVLSFAASAAAHDVSAPIPHEQPRALWPGGRASAHDVVVPLQLVINPDGSVGEIVIDASLGPELDAAAIETAKHWLFEPARSDGQAVAAKVRAVVRFVGVPQAHVHRDASGSHTHTHAADPPAAPVKPVVVGHGADVGVTEIRVSGSKPPARSASEIVRERSVLQAAPHRTASDLLLTVPGMTLVNHGGAGDASQMFFRGFDAVHGQDVEIWAGGAPVNDVSNLHAQGYADLHYLMPEVVKSIRSQPGSYDPRQGDFAVAGSLNLELGYDQPGVTAKAAVGSFDTRRYFLAYRPKGESDQTFAAFELYASDGFGVARAARRTSAIAQSEFHVGDRATLRVMGSSYASNYGSAGVLRVSDIHSGRIDRFGSYDSKQGGDAARTQLVFDLHDAEGKSRWSIAPYFVLHSTRLRQNFTGYYAQPIPGTGSAQNATAASSGNSEQQINDATTFGSKAWYRFATPLFSESDAVEAGVSARHDRIQQSQKRLSVATSAVTLDEIDAKVQGTNVGGYVDANFTAWKRITLRGGLRLDGLAYASEDTGGVNGQGQRRSTQGAHLGKKATAEVLLLRGLHAVASYGEGFRSPQARSLADNEKTPFTTVVSYEAGVRYREGPFRASAAAFRTTLSDDLAFDQATTRFQRTPATARNGLTTEFLAEPAPWFMSSASITYTHAAFRVSEGDYVQNALVPYVPQITGRVDMAYTPKLARLLDRDLKARLGTGVTYFARRPLPYQELGHDAFLVDATASLRLQEVQLGVDVYNALNAKWFEGEYVYASSFAPGAAPSLVPQRHVSVGPPASIMATLSLFL